MHGLISAQAAAYKGMPPLRLRRHGGVIAIGNALGNSVVRAGSKQPQVGGGDKGGQQTPYDPDTGGYSPVAEFDPQQAYRVQAANNLSAQVSSEFQDFDFSLSLGAGDVANFFQSEQTRSFLSDRALAGDGLAGYRAGLTPGVFANAIMPAETNQKSSSFDLGKTLSDYGTLSTAYSLGYEALKQVPYVDDVINTMRAVPEAIINPSMDIELPKGSSGFIDGIGKGFFWLQTAYEVPKFIIEEGSYAFENRNIRSETLTKGADLAVTTGLGYAATINPWIGVPALAWTFKSEIHDAAIKGHQLKMNDIENNPTQFPIGPKF